MSTSPHLPAVLLGLTLLPATLAGQARPSYEGAFARAYPEAAALLAAFEASHAALLERLYTGRNPSPEQVEGADFAALQERARTGSVPPGAMDAAMPALSHAAPRLAALLDRAHALHREIYDVFADDHVIDKAATVDAAIDRYLARPETALPAVSKSMEIMDGASHAGAFRTAFPKTNGAMWASHWLRLALYDPLMYYATAGDRRAGIETVVERFRAKLAGAPGTLPAEMPTPAAISPELTRRFPRAAAIFDNLHMLHDVVADLLVEDGRGDERAAIEEAVAHFTDPVYLASTPDDWMAMSLRHGIYDQGGPAIGSMERSERNSSAHAGHGAAAVFSGMGSGLNGATVTGEAGEPVQPPKPEELDPHAGH